MYRGGGRRFLPNRPHPLSSFDTHARWQPVTQSARSRWSYGKIEDCEQSNNVGATHAHYKYSPKSFGLYLSTDALQVLALLGVVDIAVSVSTPLPTRKQKLLTLLLQHWCWELLRSFARSLTISTGSRQTFFLIVCPFDCFTRALFHCWC